MLFPVQMNGFLVTPILGLVQVQDCNPYSIGISSDEGPICIGSNTNGEVFPKGQPIPCVKVLTLQRSSLFHLELFYTNPNELPPGISSKVSCFTVSVL